MLEAIVLLCIGLALLVWSADRLVYGAAALAKNLGVTPLVIGMTILAMGSSAPEMMVSATAALEGKTDTAVGNVLGSNIANIALILGLTAILKPLAVSSGIIRRELPLMMGVTLVAGVLLWDSYLGFYEGVLLVVLFVAFLLTMLKISRNAKAEGNDPLVEEQESEIPDGVSNPAALIWVAIGLVLLPYAASMLVDSAVTIAKYFGMSDLVIGLTIIAIGTSLPELAASIASLYKGEDDMAVGNIIGSNVFNILAVMGIPGLLNPSALSPLAMGRDYYVMLAVSVLLVLMALGKRRVINRLEGGVLVLCFIAYQAYLFYNMAA
ncbi:calcium/sodium antiporter [Photobacterium sanctipauli]|uniref:Calcium/sodium antiporter n=1 Tax=Photobacterium sanctipauli TaxID=1342794 RepID=A0A2T3NQC8_9GAMM|nr:calcium/sodium antiporter [Photobacterium sanctipauli]PSW18470.1 calcium/sodium antiporter [Photobacterium sanctipauli]